MFSVAEGAQHPLPFVIVIVMINNSIIVDNYDLSDVFGHVYLHDADW